MVHACEGRTRRESALTFANRLPSTNPSFVPPSSSIVNFLSQQQGEGGDISEGTGDRQVAQRAQQACCVVHALTGCQAVMTRLD